MRGYSDLGRHLLDVIVQCAGILVTVIKKALDLWSKGH